MNDFDSFQIRQRDIYPSNVSLEYVTLKLTSKTGNLAREASYIARGDYKNKGSIASEMSTDRVMEACDEIVRCVALIVTIFEKKLSDVLEAERNEGERNGNESRT